MTAPVPERDWWHLAWCLECTTGAPGEEVPFTTRQARQEWVQAHQDGTGHSAWRTLSVRRDTPAEVR